MTEKPTELCAFGSQAGLQSHSLLMWPSRRASEASASLANFTLSGLHLTQLLHRAFIFIQRERKVFAILKQRRSLPLPADTRVQLMTSAVGTGEAPAHLGWQVEQGSSGNAAHRCLSTTRHSWTGTRMIWVSLYAARTWQTHPLCPALSPSHP